MNMYHNAPELELMVCDTKRAASAPRLLDQVREVLRRKHYSIRTERTYVDWIKRFILFNNKQHPKDLKENHINAFLSHLAVRGSEGPLHFHI
jgi:hypothetical protein